MSRVETQEPLVSGSLSPISPAELTDAAWISEFLRQRWHTTIIVVHGEVIDAAGCQRTGFPSMTNSTCAASSTSAQDGKCPFSRRGAGRQSQPRTSRNDQYCNP